MRMGQEGLTLILPDLKFLKMSCTHDILGKLTSKEKIKIKNYIKIIQIHIYDIHFWSSI